MVDVAPSCTMNITSFTNDDSFAVYEHIVKFDRDEKCHDSQCSQQCLQEHVADNDPSESSVANYSGASFSSIYFEDDFDEDIYVVPSEKITSELDVSFVGRTRKVSFGGVIIREYVVVVGCQDISCPLELDWDYVRESTISNEEDYRTNSEPRSQMRPLSYRERKERIALSQDIMISEVKYLEQEMLDLRKASSTQIEVKRCLKRVDSSPRQPLRE